MTIRTIPLRIDVMRAILVESNGSPYTQKLRLVRGDDVQLNLDVVTVDPATQALTPFAFDDGTVFRLVGKREKDYGGPEVILADANTWNVTGHRTDLSVAGGKLSCRFRLNRQTLLNALGAENPSLKVVIDIEAITSAGEVSTLVQLNETILNDAARNPAAAADAGDDYVSLDEFRAMLREITHPTEGAYKLEDGFVHLWDVETEQFRRVGLMEGGLAVLEDS